jgi:hypothetical protein
MMVFTFIFFLFIFTKQLQDAFGSKIFLYSWQTMKKFLFKPFSVLSGRTDIFQIPPQRHIDPHGEKHGGLPPGCSSNHRWCSPEKSPETEAEHPEASHPSLLKCLECYIVRRATERAEPEHIEAMQATIDELKQHCDNVNYCVEQDLEFHTIMVKASNNRVLRLC